MRLPETQQSLETRHIHRQSRYRPEQFRDIELLRKMCHKLSNMPRQCARKIGRTRISPAREAGPVMLWPLENRVDAAGAVPTGRFSAPSIAPPDFRIYSISSRHRAP